MKKSTPAPIFNHRKRPRQAVIADPQNIDGPGTRMPINSPELSHRFQDLMPVHGFKPKQGYQSYQQQDKSQQNRQQYQQPNRQQQQNQQYSSAYNMSRPSPDRQSQIPNTGHQGQTRMVTGGVARTVSAPPNRQLTGQSGQGWQADKHVQQSQSWGAGQASYRQGGNSHTGSHQASYTNRQGGNNQQTPQRNVGNKMTNSYGQQQNRYNNGNQNYNGQAGSQFMFQADNSGKNSSKTNTHMNQNPFQTDTHRNQNNSFRPGPSGAATCTVQGPDNAGQHFQPKGYQRVGGFGDSSTKPSPSTTQKEPQKVPKKSENKADKSLHIITSTIQGIKHWSKYKDSVHMIFEVYGVVDSAMMRDPSATGKEFLIKDEQDSMPCVFYEIDRQLPRLTRGHWHRCVGSMDGRSGKLKCVSVRPASVEEKDISKLSIKKSDTFLRDLTKTTPEP